MRNLFAFLYRFRAFLVFVLLEALCIYLIVQYNTYQGAAFFNSANRYVGRVLEFQSGVTDYFNLSTVNNTLARENALLRQELLQYKQESLTDSVSSMDTTLVVPVTIADGDSTKKQLQNFMLHAGRVINNSVRRTNNYLTLSIGTKDGVQPGMGVIASNGVVGRVKTVSANYSTVTSLLHSQMLISAKIKKDNTMGTIKWQGGDYRTAILDYIPLHVQLAKGDTVITSGFNTVFPEGIMVGTISSVEKEADKSFYNVKVKLAVDFAQLSYVYVVENLQKAERDTIEQQAGILPNE